MHNYAGNALVAESTVSATSVLPAVRHEIM